MAVVYLKPLSKWPISFWTTGNLLYIRKVVPDLDQTHIPHLVANVSTIRWLLSWMKPLLRQAKYLQGQYRITIAVGLLVVAALGKAWCRNSRYFREERQSG